ncbi:HAD family hydrolase [Candidatus Soleaferrea massiliensis]|uniref:HAD family hydrolase n=1 Tax=Candidatus Soleaferrea massiliensis TaxID=1470354 RepID=UPI00058DFAD3|nr:HAD family hydrolase [Candidatus Soleaferrea massiliensis]
MKNKRFILFDLDGTLTDPALGITNAFRYALKAFGIEVPDVRELYRVIGPPLIDSFIDFYSFSEADARRAVEVYREYFSETGIFENKVYDGIPQLLDTLQKDGRTLLVATSKPTVFAERILEHFGLARYFSFVSGSGLDGAHSRKDEVIEIALERMRVNDRSEAVMVGDRAFDIEGAKLSGIDAVGVLYGYGSRGELEKAGAKHIAEDIGSLRRMLLGG